MTDPKPVHEETWSASLDHVDLEVGDERYRIADFFAVFGDEGANSFKRAELAAAAPELARALLALMAIVPEIDTGLDIRPVWAQAQDALRKAGIRVEKQDDAGPAHEAHR